MYTRSQRLFRKKIFTTLIGIFILFWATSVIATHATKQSTVNAKEEHYISLSELSKYDGTQTDRPIYLAFEGRVYDITTGYKYYAIGGIYHFLAGRDATNDLHIAGGDIVKRKYPVIGVLKK